jgi:hypothetical protein
MNEDLKNHLRKKLFEAFDPPFAADEEGDIEDLPSFSPVPKPYILPNGEYSWYPNPLPGTVPPGWLLSPRDMTDFDSQTTHILQWINTLDIDDIITSESLLDWLLWVFANSNNLSLPSFMNPEIEDLLFDMVRENLNYRAIYYDHIINRLIAMNNMDIQDRIRKITDLINYIEAFLHSINPWTEMVELGIMHWRHLQHMMPYGWYPSSPEDQENFFNDPYIQPWPGMPLKIPTDIPWWDVNFPEDPIFNDEDMIG